jgi:hypothetical protein
MASGVVSWLKSVLKPQAVIVRQKPQAAITRQARPSGHGILASLLWSGQFIVTLYGTSGDATGIHAPRLGHPRSHHRDAGTPSHAVTRSPWRETTASTPAARSRLGSVAVRNVTDWEIKPAHPGFGKRTVTPWRCRRCARMRIYGIAQAASTAGERVQPVSRPATWSRASA